VERSPELEYPGGESLAELNNRVSKFLGRLEKHAEEETVLIVSHSGALRTLICQLLSLGLRFRWQLRLDFASLSIIDTYQGGAILHRLNDVSHLVEKDS
jgi:broad specificity phosphatase PhoE